MCSEILSSFSAVFHICLPCSCFSTRFSSTRIEEISCGGEQKTKKKRVLAPNNTLHFSSLNLYSGRSVSAPCWRISGVMCRSPIAVYSQFRPSFCPYLWTKSCIEITGHMSQFVYTKQLRGINTLWIDSTTTWFFLQFYRWSSWSWWTAEKLNWAPSCPTPPENRDRRQVFNNVFALPGGSLHVGTFLRSCSPPPGSRCVSLELGAPGCQGPGGVAPLACRWSLAPYWLKSQAGSFGSSGFRQTRDPPTAQRQTER